MLPTGVFVEAGRAERVGDHVGATALPVKKEVPGSTGRYEYKVEIGGIGYEQKNTNSKLIL